MTTTSKGSEGTSRRTIKRKLDDSILKKAREALGLPVESQDVDDDQKKDEPSLKWRKPRHNTAEGKVYVENKEKRRKLEEDETRVSSILQKAAKKDKKTKKGKKKKKKKNNDGSSTETSKNPEGEKKHTMEGISYLQLWSTNRDHWKFEKRKQTWLLKNCLNSDLIDDARFEILLGYIASVKGAARKATINEMQSVVKRRESLGDSGDEPDNSINDITYDRARQVIQMLVDE